MTVPSGEHPALDPSITAMKAKDAGVPVEGAHVEQAETRNVDAEYLAIQQEAIKKVEETLVAEPVDVEEILKRLVEEKKMDYTARSLLTESVLRVADVKRLSDESMDEQIQPVMKAMYRDVVYSKMFQDAIIGSLKQSKDADLIGVALADEKFSDTFSLCYALDTDEARERAFQKCKQRVRVAAHLLSGMKDPDRALQMLRDLPGLSGLPPDRRSMDVGRIIEGLASSLLKEGKIDALVDAAKTGTILLSEMKPVINRLQEQPSVLLELAKAGHDLAGVKFLLKFLADPEQIQSLIDGGVETFSNLSPDEAKAALEFAQKVKGALTKEPRMISLGSFMPDQQSEVFKNEMDAHNKFVVGIDSNHAYCVVWGNMDRYEYHKDLFQAAGYLEKCGGGHLSFTEEPDRIKIKMNKSSSDFGLFSNQVIERFRQNILDKMKQMYPDKQIELVVERSFGY